MNYNMKKIILILFVVMVIGFVAGGFSFMFQRNHFTSNQYYSPSHQYSRSISFGKKLWNFSIGSNTTNLEKYTIDEEVQYKLEENSTIQVNNGSTAVNFYKSEGDEVKIHFSGMIETNSGGAPKLVTKLRNKELSIAISHHNTSFSNVTNRQGLRLDVYLPQGYLEELDIKSSSGAVSVDKIKVKELNISSSSGSINAGSITADKTSMKATSGHINIDNFMGELEAETSSGGIRVYSADTSKTKVKANSGSITLVDFTGDLEGQTTSGSIQVEYNHFNHNVDLKASSGKIVLKLPEDANFRINAETSSGRLDSQFPILMTSSNKRELVGNVGKGGNRINLKTTSGSILLHYK